MTRTFCNTTCEHGGICNLEPHHDGLHSASGHCEWERSESDHVETDAESVLNTLSIIQKNQLR